MKLERRQTVLLVGLSILLFRLLSVAVSLGMMPLRHVPVFFVVQAVEILHAYEAVIACGLGVFLALFAVRRIRTAHLAVVVVVWILALLPLQYRLRQEFVLATPTAPEIPAARPLSLAVRLIEGETIDDVVLLDNTHVARAEAVPRHDDTHQVKLYLTEEGRRVLREVMRRHVGKRLGFFLDGDLMSSPEILEPLDTPYVVLPVRTTSAEAQRIVEDIMKDMSQSENGLR
jgi:hypothetical protein